MRKVVVILKLWDTGFPIPIFVIWVQDLAGHHFRLYNGNLKCNMELNGKEYTKQVMGSFYITEEIENQSILVILPNLGSIGVNPYIGLCGLCVKLSMPIGNGL